MTITCQPMDATAGLPAYSAQNERQGMAPLFGGGSGLALAARSGFRVGTASNILSATSTTWTLLPCSALITPGAATAQGSYRWASDQNVTGSVTAADATYTRKDIVYVQVNDSSSGDGSGALTAPVLYLAGTPSASPVAPALPARSFLVGTITVPQSGGGSPTVVLNTARFVAAGGILPVANDAERLALSGYEGLLVDQFDVDRIYRHNGSRWAQASNAELGRTSTGVGGTLAATPSWSDIMIVTATSLGGEIIVDYDITLTNANSGAHRDAALRVTCDGVEVLGWTLTCPYTAGIDFPVSPSLEVNHTPAAGSHTWKLQGNASVAGAVQVRRGSMSVTEKP